MRGYTRIAPGLYGALDVMHQATACRHCDERGTAMELLAAASCSCHAAVVRAAFWYETGDGAVYTYVTNDGAQISVNVSNTLVRGVWSEISYCTACDRPASLAGCRRAFHAPVSLPAVTGAVLVPNGIICLLRETPERVVEVLETTSDRHLWGQQETKRLGALKLYDKLVASKPLYARTLERQALWDGTADSLHTALEELRNTVAVNPYGTVGPLFTDVFSNTSALLGTQTAARAQEAQALKTPIAVHRLLAAAREC